MWGRRECLPVVALVLVLATGAARAFLATQLNTTDPDIAGILCPDQATEVTRDHEWITREAVRRNIRDFFLAYPPGGRPDFLLPADATLTELFHTYYGETASPTRFIKAVNSIVAANVQADSLPQYRFDPAIHGDGERLSEVQAKLVTRYPQILTAILRDEAYPAARSLLGTSLHSIQKFYAHSTWIEQGHDTILEALGIPGNEMEGLANDAEDVCTSCSSAEGCSGNVIAGAGLSSGYYVYPEDSASSYLVPKPETGGKCSHGGVLDDSRSQPAVGGVNKDTSYPCFSPHYHLHLEAVQLALQATDYYLKQVLQAVGADMYRRLFDLYQGSALSICIDTTGSMGDDIAAVQDQVAQIVANSNPEIYVLAPYNDPSVGPLLKTDDSEEFLAAVNALTAGGGGDEPEKFWSGLQLALSATPAYGDIFCFTDASAKDGDLMESLISLAQQQNNKVTVILSDIYRRKNTGEDYAPGELDREEESDRTRDVNTGVAEYQRLADETGGLLISTDKFNVDDIVNIIGAGIETASVTILNLVEVTGTEEKLVPVDDSIVDLEVRLTGSLTSAIFTDVTGISYDLMDRASLEATGVVEVVSYTTTFKAVRWPTPVYGEWTISTVGADSYSVTVLATSPIDFLAGFSVLDPNPPHPHYQPIDGRPLMETVYYLDLTLVGYLEGDVITLDTIYYVDKAGEELRAIPYSGELADHLYIRTEPLPEESFFLVISGHVSTGKRYQRVQVVLITPVSTSVEVRATSEDLSARPGESTTAVFVVTNYGLTSYFDISGTDDLGFLTTVTPARVHLATNESAEVVASFTVPTSALSGSVSTVVVTAQSESQTRSVNSAVAHFVVLSTVDDSEPPICKMLDWSNCTGYTDNGICSLSSWTLDASLQDIGSGLYQVRAQPTGEVFEVTDLTPGTTSEVLTVYENSCCYPYVELIGVDGQANVGKCVVDMGPLGGMIYNFEVVTAGDTYMILHWNITPSHYEIYDYDLLVDSEFVQQITCKEDYCVALVSYLEPCTAQTFNLTPVFDYNGEKLPGIPAYTQGDTLDDEVPHTPFNATEVDRTEVSITISWEAINPKCSHLFQVCYYEVDSGPEFEVCANTTDTTFTLDGLLECRAYFLDVSGYTPAGVISSPLHFYSVTLCPDEASRRQRH
nr:von Willebrand factor A domain-containing protein 7-like isoform X1 [Procambarus clarkii]